MTNFLQQQPAHIGYDCWNLAEGYNPELLLNLLHWLVQDPERRNSAIEHIQPILGFNALSVALDRDENTGRVVRSIQLNFYDGSRSVCNNDIFRLTEEPHAHSKDSFATWYATEGVKQVITRFNVLPSDQPPVEGVEAEQRLVVANCIQGLGNGRRSQYKPIELGTTSVSTLSRSWVTNGGMTLFNSSEVHSVGANFITPEQVAISVHYKGRAEVDSYNTHEGLMLYKKLTSEQASRVLKFREENTGYPGPITMMYPRIEQFNPEALNEYPNNANTTTAERLLYGGLATIMELCERRS